MAQFFTTSAAGYELIERFEGLHKVRPDGLIEAYKIAHDPVTIGIGQTGKMPDGRPVVMGLVITEQEARDALQYFVRNVTEPLVRKHFNARTQGEFDALVSWTYNISAAKLEAGKYSLPQFVNVKDRDLNGLIDKWVQYVNPGTIFEQGLYRRRLAEICMFLGLPWHFALTAILKRASGMIVDRTDPYYIIDIAEASVPIYSAPDVPKPPAPVVPVEVAPLPEVPPVAPNVDTTIPPKPMEESKTFNGLSKKESGQETVAVGGTLAGLAVFLPYIDAVTAYLSKYPATVIFSALGVVGLLTAGVGAWRWYAGKMIAFEGRQEAVQAKV
jgi:GH24 family phage-related lysozyme (muramidase)